MWSPDETLAFAAKYLTAVGKPGEKFHYSDTGYDLLGFVLERAGGKPLHVLLNEEILVPQGLMQTKWIFYDNIDEEPLFPETYVADQEVSRNKSVSISWGGGNLLVTADDLISFHRALVKGKVIKPTSLDLLMENPHRFAHGMDYSCGLFHLQINKMSFGLLPDSHFMWGNMGSTATFMFYNPAYDVYLAGAFNNSEFMSKQVQFLIKTVDIISKIN